MRVRLLIAALVMLASASGEAAAQAGKRYGYEPRRQHYLQRQLDWQRRENWQRNQERLREQGRQQQQQWQQRHEQRRRHKLQQDPQYLPRTD